MGIDVGINLGASSISAVFVGGTITAATKAANFPGSLGHGLASCLEDGAREAGFSSVRAMLRETDSVVVSAPAVVQATLTQKSGPNIGVLVTRGLQQEIRIGGSSKQGDPGPAVLPEMIESVDEEVDLDGRATREPGADEVREAVRRLLQRGAETIVVGLRRSPLNRAHEAGIRAMIEEEYPAHYLGAVPVVLSSDHGVTMDDELRIHAALLNAYCTRSTAKLLHEAEDVLRHLGFIGVMGVLDSAGVCARVSHCVPIHCVDSDLAADRYVALEIVGRCDLEEVVLFDLGASDTRIACVTSGDGAFGAPRPRPDASSASERDVRHVALGSHDVVSVQDGRVVAGPGSATPACYGTGDEEPTLTDALVVLGLLDPDGFAGARSGVGFGYARQALERVAAPLGVTPEDAAVRAVALMVESTTAAIRDAMTFRNSDCREVTLLALGGASGAVCADVARGLGVTEVYSPFAGWAASALGGLAARVRGTGYAAGPVSQGRLFHEEATGSGEGVVSGSPPDYPSSALVRRREAFIDGVPTTVDVVRRESLQPGDVVAGPAVVESRGDTFVVPNGMSFALDGCRGGTIGRTKTPAADGILCDRVWASERSRG